MKTALVIEDNRVAAGIYRSLLKGQGFTVEVASDGEAGMQMVKQMRPDVVLLDLILPKIDGAGVLRQIRALPETATTPVIIVSNAYSQSRIDELWAAGATLVLTKASSTPRELVNAVNSVVAS